MSAIGIKPTVDVVFKRLFGSPEHANLTLSFVNEILNAVGRPTAASLEILNPWRLAEFQGDKEIVVDVRAVDEAGRDFQVEMQVRPDRAPGDRMLDNWSRIFSAQVRKGEDYTCHRPVISIWILEHELFPDPAWLHPISTADEATRERFGDRLLIVVVELRKWSALSKPELGVILGTGIDAWLSFLAGGENLDPDDQELCASHAEIGEALKIMSAFTKSQKAQYTYYKRMEWKWLQNDWNLTVEEAKQAARELGLAEGRVEGIAEGRVEGIAEGRVEGRVEGTTETRRAIAKGLKEKGLDARLIAETTYLPLEEVENL